VAYRFFSTEKRKFIVADTPGHEQYTRNMITGASTADLAVVLIDARKGVLTQTRRHSYLANLIGVRNFALAVNKMDLIGYDQAKYDAIVADYRAFAESIGIKDFVALPISGLAGDNITIRSNNMPWYKGRRSSNIWKRSNWMRRAIWRSRFACRCSGSTGRTWIFAASPV
jgi:bifunctional enzyme CysN/CysC